MALWHTPSRTRSNDTGKFRRHAKIGVSRSGAGRHLGWHFDIIAHQIGASVRRTSYNVAISDSSHARVAYLRGFTSAVQATAAAKELIARSQRRRFYVGQAGNVGTVPPLPAAQENPLPTAQEK